MQLQHLKLWQRELALANAGYLQDAPQPTQCIVWEDPADLDAPARITTPSPQWLRMATLGGVLPPVEAYHSSRLEIEVEGGRTYNVSLLEADDVRRELRQRGRLSERVVRYDVHEAPVLSSMTETEAVDYILRKDTPHRVWGEAHNRPMFWTTERRLLPQSRFVRNAWVLGEAATSPVSVDMNRARQVFLNDLARRYRAKRRELREELEVDAWLVDRDVAGELRQLDAIDPKQIQRKANEAESADDLERLIPDVLKE
jgi:hypothetical protein